MITEFKIFEGRKFKKTVVPIADFLFDNFFGDIGYNVRTRELKTKTDIKSYEIDFAFYLKYQSLKNEYLDMIKECINFINLYCVKNSLKFNFMYWNYLNIKFKISPINIEKIKELPEYRAWEIKNRDNYDLFMAKKDAKKYNL